MVLGAVIVGLIATAIALELLAEKEAKIYFVPFYLQVFLTFLYPRNRKRLCGYPDKWFVDGCPDAGIGMAFDSKGDYTLHGLPQARRELMARHFTKTAQTLMQDYSMNFFRYVYFHNNHQIDDNAI